MKLLKQGARLSLLATLVASVVSASAVEGLRLTVQCPDIILGWSSLSGETYIVQWRPTLSPTTPWETLANSVASDETANWTTFVHSNQVQCAAADTDSVGGGESGPSPTPNFAQSQALEPLVKRADGSGSTVPLCIYPPGFDLSGFVVFDPTTGGWASGSGSTPSQALRSRMRPMGPQLQDGPTNGPTRSGPGFYRVVANGLRFFGLTNGAVLSGVVDVPIEMALTSTDQITGLAFYAGNFPSWERATRITALPG